MLDGLEMAFEVRDQTVIGAARQHFVDDCRGFVIRFAYICGVINHGFASR